MTIKTSKTLVFDIDGTICPNKKKDQEYKDLIPYPEIVASMKEYKAQGFHIVLATARNMVTHGGNHGLLCAKTLPVLIEWLDSWGIPYDEIHMGKPYGQLYIDDKAVRPDEFLNMTYDELLKLTGQ